MYMLCRGGMHIAIPDFVRWAVCVACVRVYAPYYYTTPQVPDVKIFPATNVSHL